jgi:hypothetical protein
VIKVGRLAKIRRLYFRDKLSIREISHQTCHSRNTVRTWLREPVQSIRGLCAAMGWGASLPFKEGFGLCLYLPLPLPLLYRVSPVQVAYLVGCLDPTYRFKAYLNSGRCVLRFFDSLMVYPFLLTVSYLNCGLKFGVHFSLGMDVLSYRVKA